jgi:hypothetical protein
MSRFLVALFVALLLASPARAFGEGTGLFEDFEFVDRTTVAAGGESGIALCYSTNDIRFLGYTVFSDITGYALVSEACAGEVAQRLTPADMQELRDSGQISPSIPLIARNSLQRNLTNYGLWAAIILGLIAVIIRRVKSLLGYDLRGPLRRKTTQRIIKALCHAGQCDGVIDSHDIALIRKTAARLTRRALRTADIVKVADKIDARLTPQDYVALGNGLRDGEKDVMMQAVFYLTLQNGRLLPSEYEFLTGLAYGIGMPGEDFRRVMNVALGDLDLYPPR